MGDKPKIDLQAGYTPFPAQEAFHKSAAQWRLLAGGFGGGKTKPACREAIATALAYPRSLGLIARLEYRPLMDSTWRTFLRELRECGLYDKRYVKITGGNAATTPPHIRFADELGGSEIIFRNAANEENFYGVEPDWVFVDEGSEVPDNIYEVIGGRLRGTPNKEGRIANADGVRVSGPLRVWIATNPGPSNFIRRNFAPLGLPGKPTSGFETFAVPTLDNPTLPDSYIHFLKTQYVGARYDAFVRGDWSAFEGQVFTMYDPEVHLIDNLDAPALRGRIVIEGWDFGRAVETAVVWIAVDPEGRDPILVFHDYGAAEREVGDHAREAKRVRKHYGLKEVICVGDPAGSQRGASGSYFEEYARQGIYIAPMNAGKLQSVRDERLAQYLAARLYGTIPARRRGELVDLPTPAITFCRRCEFGVVQSMLMAQYRPHKNAEKDRPDERAKKDDHRLDALEYALMAAPPPSTLPGPPGEPPPRRGVNPRHPTPATISRYLGTDGYSDVA